MGRARRRSRTNVTKGPPDLDLLLQSAGRSVGADGSISTDHYLGVFNQLVSLFDHWSPALTYALHGVSLAVESLEIHRVSGVKSDYSSLDLMLAYEHNNKLAEAKDRQLMSGTAALWVMHRSMTFMLEFMRALHDAAVADKAFKHPQRVRSYMDTIGQWQSLLKQSQVKLRLIAQCPGRRHLLEKLCVWCQDDRTPTSLLGRLLEKVQSLSTATAQVFLSEQRREN